MASIYLFIDLGVILYSMMVVDTIMARKVGFFSCCKLTMSNHILMKSIAKGLYDRGYGVTLILSSHLFTDQDKYTFPGAEIIWYDSYTKEMRDSQQTLRDLYIQYGYWNATTNTKKNELHSAAAEKILQDELLFNKLKGANFDLIILRANPIHLSLIPFRLSLPFIYFTSYYNPWLLRIPFLPSFVPHFLTVYSDKMTFAQRFLNTLATVKYNLRDYWKYADAVKRLSPNQPYISLFELRTKAELWIIQTDTVLNYPRPTLPNVKFIGGLTVEPAKKLSKYLNDFVDRSKNGFIYMSWGSGDFNLPGDIIDLFLRLFEVIRFEVIWKTHKDVNTKNILKVTWLNQNDILGCKNIKLFISHCGANGLYEALYHAVPILCIPLYHDQFYMAEIVTRKGFGKALNWETLVESELQKTIVELIHNSTVKENVNRASEIMHASGRLPRDEAAYWIDHVIKYGGSYMRSESQNITWYQYLLLDIAVVCFVCLCILTSVCGCVSFLIVKYVCLRKSGILKNKTD